MRYIDTSVLIAYLIREIHSPAAESFMLSRGGQLAISTWTEVELFSALGIKLRTKQLTQYIANSAIDIYRRSISPQLRRIAVTDAHHRQAALLLDGWRSSLRAGDSLHLAIASSHRATIYTLDGGMASAGGILGISVQLLRV